MLTLVPDLPRHDGRSSLVAPSGLSFRELRDRGVQAAEAGDLTQALVYHRESLEVARVSGDRNLIDLATCNCATVRINLGEHLEVAPGLRQILMVNRCPKNAFLAALNLSRVHVRCKAPKKALFYAQVARDRALAVARDELLVWSYNQLANCLVDESRFQEASREYQRALALLSEKPSVLRASLLANLGYCRMMLDGVESGLQLTFRSLRWFRYFGARVYEVWPELDLCYAYIELGRFGRARDHGLRALCLAQETGEPDRVKNALYLLGETERAAGDLEQAYGYFSRLQREFYPESPHLVDLMVAVEMRQLVNLRA